MDDVSANPNRIGRAFGAIGMGLFVALIGFGASFASGMATAPSHVAGAIAMAILAAGVCLCALGILALWVPRLRAAAAMATLVATALLVFAFVINMVIGALGSR